MGGSDLSAPEDAAVFLIFINDRAAVVDIGCGKSVGRILENISLCGVSPSQIDYLLLTHCHFDHTGGAKHFRELTGCQIVAHELDAVYLEKGDNRVTAASWYGATISPFSIDRKLTESSEIIELGGRSIEVVHIPGHSPGSVVYLIESDHQKVLFGQDVHGPLDASLLSDKNAYVKSLQKMISLEADILCEGHFGIYKEKENVKRFIYNFLT